MIVGSRSTSSVEDELRLPRAPGVLRQFWTRHPRITDTSITLVCLFLSLAPAAPFGRGAEDETRMMTPATAAVLVVVIVLGCATLMVRRRWPLVPLGAAFVVAFAYLLSPLPAGGPLLLIAAYSLATRRSTRACVIGLAVGLGTLITVVATLALAGVIAWDVAWNVIVGESLAGLIGGLVGANVGNRRRYLDAVIGRSRQLIVERDQQAALSAAAERTRIAREMHDIVSHSLTVIVALADGASATTDQDRARRASEQVAETARGALREMRAMLGVLREGDAAAPLAPVDDDAIGAAVDGARRAGFPVSVRTSGDGAMPRTVQFAAARLVQEGLTNAMRHAPGATRIDVEIASTPGEVTVAIRNDGVSGVAPDSGGYGLRGLAERVEHVGGTLDAGPDGPSRWTLRARIPLHAEEPS